MSSCKQAGNFYAIKTNACFKNKIVSKIKFKILENKEVFNCLNTFLVQYIV